MLNVPTLWKKISVDLYANCGKFYRLNSEASCDLHYSIFMKSLRAHPSHLTRANQLEPCKRGCTSVTHFQLLCMKSHVISYGDTPLPSEKKYFFAWEQVCSKQKTTTFWLIALCSLAGVDRRFRGAYCLHHQGFLLLQRDYMVIHPRELLSSYSPPWEHEISHVLN
jgi:hypothetical protein